MQVSGLQQLHRLSLPFPITSSHLQRLCQLPHLDELLSFNKVELDVLGPAHDPLASVTKLVTSSIDSHGKPLAALFPALQSVYLRSCGDMEALSLRSCGGGLSVLAAGDCSGLTDEGFAGLRVLRGLTRLQMDNAHQVRPAGNTLQGLRSAPVAVRQRGGCLDRMRWATACSCFPGCARMCCGGCRLPCTCSHGQVSLHGVCPSLTVMPPVAVLPSCMQLSDLSFVAMFSSTMPALHHVSLSGCSNITDTALQLLTASCRRLATISISNCPQLTDKTLKRLAHCEHLGTVSIKACRGFTAEGVSALVAAPQVKAVSVVCCPGVRKSHLRGCKQGAKLRVVSDSERSTSESGRRVSESSRGH